MCDLEGIEYQEFNYLLGELNSVSLDLGREDVRVWLGDFFGSFSASSFYESFFPINIFLVFQFYLNIWKVPIPYMVQVFSWTLALGKLQTCDSLQKRWPTCALSPNWCGLCRIDEEDQDHLLLHCSFTKELWSRVLKELRAVWVSDKGT